MEQELNRRELERYLERVTDRWPVQRALLAGARVDDLHGAPPQRERGHEYVLVLVSEHFDGVPWLERVYQARFAVGRAARWARAAEVHCYTPAEFERKREQLKVVRAGRRSRARAVARARVTNRRDLGVSQRTYAVPVADPAPHPDRRAPGRAGARRSRARLRGDRRALPQAAAARGAPRASGGARGGRAAAGAAGRLDGAAARRRGARAAAVAVPDRPQHGAQRAAGERLRLRRAARGGADRATPARRSSSAARSCARRWRRWPRCPTASARR